MGYESPIESDIESGIDEDYDSDAALQDAFAKGLLKPGLNVPVVENNRVYKNNKVELRNKLADMKLSLPWIETLELVNGLAPLAPELALKMEESEQGRERFIRNHNARKREKVKLSLESDPVMAEFRREMLFHRQAQAAVLEGIPLLQEAGVMSKRPTDYFAQMAKSDEHMQKVRRVLLNKQMGTERSEKAKQQRQAKKVAKEVHIATKLKKVEEKRQMLAEVKKFRKGTRKDLDFLDDSKKKPKKKLNAGPNKRVNDKRVLKDQKYGFGGKKSGKKRNTARSNSATSSGTATPYGTGKRARKEAVRAKPPKPRNRPMKGKSGSKMPRPGKSKRVQKGKR